MTNRSQAPNLSIVRGLLIAGVLLAVAATLRLLSPDHLSPDFARRMMGVLLGIVVVVYANEVPKALSPLIQMRCDPAEEQAIRRFTGWSLVLGGVAYAAAWMVAPLGTANLAAGILLGAALVIVVVRCAWSMARGPRQ
jgi:hypothetical protein